MNIMHYTEQAEEWMEGLPIGNGRLAAMVWGEDSKDVLNLNHEWLWRGIHRNRKAAKSKDHLEEVRSFLKAGDYFRATHLANIYFAGNGGLSPEKRDIDPFQPAGSLEFCINDTISFISRTLDIKNGFIETRRKTPDCNVISIFFVSSETNLIMSEWHSDNEHTFSGELYHARVQDNDAIYSFNAQTDELVFNCQFKGGISHRVVSKIKSDGEITVLDDKLIINNATFIKCITNIATSVFDIEEELKTYPITSDMFDDFSNEKEKHSNKFSDLMNGVSLKLNEDEKLDSLTIPQRLERMRMGKRDNKIVELYFNYGRYLMISSSVCGDLPANLQGKWNDKIAPPWNCDYHFDINLQMNYWLAEPCNLTKCNEALLKYIETFYESGKKSAYDLYGCRGIFIPLQCDAWGIATPESFGWAVWIGGGAWIAQHFWLHYIYTGDKEFLKNRAYRFFKEVAAFYEDYLVKDDNGIFQIMPSQSPENSFLEAGSYKRSMPVSICISSAMDVQLCYDAFNYAISAAEILGIDEKEVSNWKNIQSKLPEFKIGSDGRLLEWNEEFTEHEEELGHRHLSHLYGVFPSELFTKEKRTEQFLASEKSLKFRLSHGGGHTGWSRAWVSALYARFDNADGFYEHFIALIRDFATSSLLCLHPPRIFQIDGNLGGVATLIEAIISFTDNKVHLLRALPKEWQNGELKGVKVPGGHTIDLCWNNGRVTELRITIGYSGKITICQDGTLKEYTGKVGEVVNERV